MDCRTTTSLRFNQHDPIMTQEQSVLAKLDTFFKSRRQTISTQCFGV